MSTSFYAGLAPAVQALAAKRRPNPYAKDDDEIPLELYPMSATQNEQPSELPIAQNRIPRLAPAEAVTAPQPLSKEDEIDLTPINDQRASVTPNEQAAINRKITIPDKPTRKTVERGGFLGTLKSIGRGALLGLAEGGRGGGGGAIGGALAGAVIGGVSPQAVEDIKFQHYTMPKYEHERELAEDDLKNQEALISGVGARTGYDPVSQQPTEATRHRLTQEEQNRINQENLNFNRQQQQATRDRNATTAERRAVTAAKNLFLSRIAPNTPVDQINQAYKSRFGEDLPAGMNPHKHRFVDTGETWENVDQFSGQSSTVTNQQTGNALPSPKGAAMTMREHAQKFREYIQQGHLTLAQQREYRIATKGADGESSAKAETYRQMHDAGQIDDNGMVVNPRYEAAVQAAMATARIMHPDDESAARKEAEAHVQGDKKIEPKIPFSKSPAFQGAVGAKKYGQAPRGQGRAPQDGPKRLSAADVKAYADRAYNKTGKPGGGDVNAARQRIASDHPDWVLP
jgi:hypothetical protein